MRLHFLLLLTFAQDEKKVEPTMNVVEDREMVGSFLKWLQKDRALRASTLGTYTDHLINGLRFSCSRTGTDYKCHPMYRWLTAKSKEYRQTTHSTARDSWQSLAQKKQWIDWYVLCVCMCECT